jgi:segregation and condensation protein B
MNNDLNKKLAELEALLFVYGEPISVLSLSKYLSISEEECQKLINEYNIELQKENRGLILLINNNFIQLGTKPEYSYLIENLIKKDLSEDLTPASLETLSIILYFGPISRSKIEYLRGVDSSFILRSLILRGLIERFPDPKSPHTYLYDIGLKLLRHLGITKKEDLPDYEKFKKLNEQLEKGSLNNDNHQNLEELKENKIEASKVVDNEINNLN